MSVARARWSCEPGHAQRLSAFAASAARSAIALFGDLLKFGQRAFARIAKIERKRRPVELVDTLTLPDLSRAT